MSIGNGGIIGKINSTTNTVASGVFTIREQEKLSKTEKWPQVINVSVTPNVTVVNEGGTVTFNVIAGGVPNGTTLYWTTNQVSGTINTSDFIDGVSNGSFSVTNGVSQITRTLALDGTSEAGDSFSISIRSGSVSGPILATSSAVTINDLVFTIQPSVSPVDEGSSTTFNITYTGINAGETIYYEVVQSTGTVNALDFTTGASGTFVTNDISNNSVALTVRLDQLTEGTESFYLILRYANSTGVLLATSATVNINDLSVSPTFTFSGISTTINEGVANNITLIASPVYASARTLTWSVTVLSGTLNFSATTGTLSNFSSSASFSVTALVSGSGGTYRINILDQGIVIASSATVTVSDFVSSPTTMTFVTSSFSTTGTTMTIPVTAQVGDIAILFDAPGLGGTTIPSVVVPAGFTQIRTDGVSATTSYRSTISSKVLVSGDPGSTITVSPNSMTVYRRIMLIFRPNSSITTVNISTAVGQGTTGTPTTQTISMAGQQTPLIGFALYRASNQITTRTSSLTMTELEAGSGNNFMFVKYIIYNSGNTPSSGTVSMADFGTNILQSFFIRFT